MKTESIQSIAIRDISNYLTKEYPLSYGCNTARDQWIIPAHSLYNKENRRLNKELGIMGINKIGNTNGCKNK